MADFSARSNIPGSVGRRWTSANSFLLWLCRAHSVIMRQRLASPVAKPREKVTVICINCAPVVLISLPMIVATMKIRKRAFPRSSFSRSIVRQTAVFIGWCYIYYWKIRVKSSSFERNDFDDYFRWIIVYLRLILIDPCLFDIFFFFFF